MKKLNYILIAAFLSILLAGCADDFLERPPKDQIVANTFYKTDEEVLAATALLYNRVWFDYNDKASYNLGDFRAGTAFSAYSDRDNVEFNTTANTENNGYAWRSFYNVVGQANTAIKNINQYAGPDVSEEIKRYAIAEARFMRALAYRFLVMNWGAVPIITNNATLLTDTTQTRHSEKSVWKFITREMRAVANDLPETPVDVGRLHKWAAEGMLARFYLTRAGVDAGPGSRNQSFLDSAKYYAKRVIDLSDAKLLANYDDLFLFPYDNKPESLFSLQWYYSGSTDWGTQNSTPAYLAFSPSIANGDGYGGDKGATLWMLEQYDGLIANGKTVDKRLKTTFMLAGAHYPEITQTILDQNGDPKDQELIVPYLNESRNYAYIKKYVTGQAKDNGGEAFKQRYGHDTYMMRLAEMYLTYVEADRGNNLFAANPLSMEYFNAVHTRAGLPEVTVPDSLHEETIFKERIIEFAMEGMAWYDFVSLYYYNPQKAFDKISNQDRGLYKVTPNQFPDPTSWTIEPTPWDNNRKFVAYEGNFRIPIPATEKLQAPNLAKEPIEYDFGDE